MNLYTDIKDVLIDKDTVVTIGTFDGLHKGHQKIIKNVVDKAVELKSRSFVVTFEPHPRKVLSKDFDIKLLTPIEEKIELFENYGVDNLLIIKFDLDFSSQTYEEFITEYIVDGIGVKHIIIGYDHKFGKNRGGNETKLIELGGKNNFDVSTVGPIDFNDDVISSTKIRNALNSGDVEKVNQFLGRSYSVKGDIVKGAQRGRELGFPTANVKVDSNNKSLPMIGVYVVKCIVDGTEYFGVLNIGNRPTFENTNEALIEVHLFDLNADLYGKEIQVKFLKRLREEKKFNNKNELIEQIHLDAQKAKDFINMLVN